jgi:hypothetical protein
VIEAIILGCFVLAYQLRRISRQNRRIDIHVWHHYDPPARDPEPAPVPQIDDELQRVLCEHRQRVS